MTTTPSLIVSLLLAVGAGVAIATQSSFVSSVGTSVGPVQTAFYIHLTGALVGAVMLGFVMLRGGGAGFAGGNLARLAVIFIIAGGLGMVILPSIALSFPRIGLVAGELAIIAGQTFIALAVDTFGLAGHEPIPFSWQRVAGLLLMLVAAYLLVPRAQG